MAVDSKAVANVGAARGQSGGPLATTWRAGDTHGGLVAACAFSPFPLRPAGPSGRRLRHSRRQFSSHRALKAVILADHYLIGKQRENLRHSIFRCSQCRTINADEFSSDVALLVGPSYIRTMRTSATEQGTFEHPVTAARTQLLTVKDVVDALRISRSSVYRLFDSGELTWIQIGSSRRIRPEDLAQFIEQHRRLAS